MPWHWKEAILQDLETSNGEYSENMEKMIVNFYGDTVYKIFYKNYFIHNYHCDHQSEASKYK